MFSAVNDDRRQSSIANARRAAYAASNDDKETTRANTLPRARRILLEDEPKIGSHLHHPRPDSRLGSIDSDIGATTRQSSIEEKEKILLPSDHLQNFAEKNYGNYY